MADSNNILLIACMALVLSACGSGDGDSANSSTFVLPQENLPQTSVATTLNALELDILNQIMQRSMDDGAQYQFDELNPVFIQDGDMMKINFEFINPNTVGGSPVVEYSLADSTITSIVYTQ